GTEQGVGVRNAGEIGADAGNVVISADGKIINRGKINAKTQIALATNHALTNEGQMTTEQHQITVNSKLDFHNKGQIVSKDSLAVKAVSIDNQGALGTQSGAVNLTSASHVTNNGKVIAGGDVNITAKKWLTNTGVIGSQHGKM